MIIKVLKPRRRKARPAKHTGPKTERCLWHLREWWWVADYPDCPPHKRDGQCGHPIPQGRKYCDHHAAMNRIKWFESTDYQSYLRHHRDERFEEERRNTPWWWDMTVEEILAERAREAEAEESGEEYEDESDS